MATVQLQREGPETPFCLTQGITLEEMADPKHLAMLQRGVKAWNDWRQKNPVVRPVVTAAEAIASSTNQVTSDQ